METYIWRLLTAMFLLLMAAVLAVFAFLLQDAVFMLGLCFYGAVLCALIGITKGFLVMIDYHRAHKDEE
ncbi:MAG: hypothetical protein IJN67_10360 [Oscillospiraceae bacterium]|nr:hypothetical protein [Oscillospiraceae bacterium]